MTEISTIKHFSIILIGIFFPSWLFIPSGPQETANMNNTSCITPWSVILSCQPIRLLGPDPQYFLFDHFWDKSSKSKVHFLECAVSVTSIVQRSTTICWHKSVKSEMLSEWWRWAGGLLQSGKIKICSFKNIKKSHKTLLKEKAVMITTNFKSF